MAFTTDGFPGRIFESVEEYEECKRLQKELKKRLGKGELVEVKEVVKKTDPKYKILEKWIYDYLQESQ